MSNSIKRSMRTGVIVLAVFVGALPLAACLAQQQKGGSMTQPTSRGA